MIRLLVLLLSLAVLLAAAPGADAKKPVRQSHVLACAALVGAPCQARLNSPGAFARLALLKGTSRAQPLFRRTMRQR
jgi:hypothetical protein